MSWWTILFVWTTFNLFLSCAAFLSNPRDFRRADNPFIQAFLLAFFAIPGAIFSKGSSER